MGKGKKNKSVEAQKNTTVQMWIRYAVVFFYKNLVEKSFKKFVSRRPVYKCDNYFPITVLLKKVLKNSSCKVVQTVLPCVGFMTKINGIISMGGSVLGKGIMVI